MEYREITPSPQLAAYVECYWSINSTPGNIIMPRPILPDGCADIIFNFGPPLTSRLSTDISVNTKPAFIVGNMTRAVLSAPTDFYKLLAIRFHPGGLRAFVDLPLCEFTDQVVSLDTFCQFRNWQEQLAPAPSLAEQCLILNRLLLQHLAPVYNPGVRQALSIIRQQHGNIRVADLGVKLGVSRKHLERTFKDIVGLTPKQTARIIQFRHMVHRLQYRGEESLLQLATDNGYTDHAHFTKSFKEFAGVTPREFLHAQS